MQKAKGVRLWLEQRKGRPAVYYIRDKEKRVSTGCGPERLEDAQKALADYLTARFRPDTSQRDLAAISIAEVLMLYGQDIAPGKASAATIGYHMKALLPYWGEKTLADVKGSTCRSYLNLRTNNSKPSLSATAAQLHSSKGRKSSVVPATVRRELKTLQASINHWHRESPLPAVPKVTLPEEGERRERVLERNEVARMLRAARRLGFDHVARFIIIGIYTGTRHNAILRLRWDSSNLAGGSVDLERGIIYRRGRSERETSKRRPPVRISGKLVSQLKRYFEQDNRVNDDSGARTVIHYNGSPILKMKRAWAKTIKEAGLGKDVTPHVLRHTAASWLLWEGKTIWDVAGIIGADASTVQKVYGHHRLTVEERKRA